ncbi:uncharacterized protein BJ171DRAFT_498322 [Polychytrium aggregatum]|uniref:uncharacterized protein n=1 Tax=Polychytrium aggregatum TaxID=110093 RepID=UPI0022FE8026|nr:uncharacterized protein BJ171DRAFT_498322 [Polychytrium aggregatum]KAI9205984.1 hypothetical protein BJ171DRAFT_498322 [Polychytrium aggregatum]
MYSNLFSNHSSTSKYRFYYADPSHKWTCNLRCLPCRGHDVDGSPCHKISCLGVPFCDKHLALIQHLRIQGSDPSRMRLFAIRPPPEISGFIDRFDFDSGPVFEQGQVIIQFEGEVINHDQMVQRYGETLVGPYTVQASDSGDRFIDAACQRGVAAIARTTAQEERANAELGHGSEGAVLRATRPIMNKEEIVVFTIYPLHAEVNDIRYATKDNPSFDEDAFKRQEKRAEYERDPMKYLLSQSKSKSRRKRDDDDDDYDFEEDDDDADFWKDIFSSKTRKKSASRSSKKKGNMLYTPGHGFIQGITITPESLGITKKKRKKDNDDWDDWDDDWDDDDDEEDKPRKKRKSKKSKKRKSSKKSKKKTSLEDFFTF